MADRKFKIKQMRERAGLSQQQVADKLGVKKARYGDWERETTILNLKTAITLAEIFDCTLDELAGRNKYPVHTKRPLDRDEFELLMSFRIVDDDSKRRILRMTQGEFEDYKKSVIEKRERSA